MHKSLKKDRFRSLFCLDPASAIFRTASASKVRKLSVVISAHEDVQDKDPRTPRVAGR